MNSTSPRKLVFVDIEETRPCSINGGQSEIIEISSSTLRNDLIIGQNRMLVKPNRTVITEALTKDTGLTQSDFCNAITFKTACSNLRILAANQVAVVWDARVQDRFQKYCNQTYLNNPLPKQVLNLSAMLTALFEFEEYPTIRTAAEMMGRNLDNLKTRTAYERVAEMVEIVKDL